MFKKIKNFFIRRKTNKILNDLHKLSNNCSQNYSQAMSNTNNSFNFPHAGITLGTQIAEKTTPVYKINLIKSENGGFVMEFTKTDNSVYNPIIPKTPKIYILNEIENLGRDIQNILLLEEIRQ